MGVIAYPASVADADTMLEAAIEAGADDVSSGEDGHEVICAQDSYGEVAKALEADAETTGAPVGEVADSSYSSAQADAVGTLASDEALAALREKLTGN